MDRRCKCLFWFPCTVFVIRFRCFFLFHHQFWTWFLFPSFSLVAFPSGTVSVCFLFIQDCSVQTIIIDCDFLARGSPDVWHFGNGQQEWDINKFPGQLKRSFPLGTQHTHGLAPSGILTVFLSVTVYQGIYRIYLFGPFWKEATNDGQ